MEGQTPAVPVRAHVGGRPPGSHTQLCGEGRWRAPERGHLPVSQPRRAGGPSGPRDRCIPRKVAAPFLEACITLTSSSLHPKRKHRSPSGQLRKQAQGGDPRTQAGSVQHPPPPMPSIVGTLPLPPRAPWPAAGCPLAAALGSLQGGRGTFFPQKDALPAQLRRRWQGWLSWPAADQRDPHAGGWPLVPGPILGPVESQPGLARHAAWTPETSF